MRHELLYGDNDKRVIELRGLLQTALLQRGVDPPISAATGSNFPTINQAITPSSTGSGPERESFPTYNERNGMNSRSGNSSRPKSASTGRAGGGNKHLAQ